ncbi:GNAT family N-acetyltransferase [Halobacillus kuroshimensis]|uniref:GNAT family N-acetyltransferase n=1 Tax=Halobacillus kuroshimensis TaxID=302481 RepID=A0ABS3E0V9_9BACI|nr:GNAT family N-acetyltransferase [Halobacillus sp. Cin3]MBN8237232.1 GNAT family N-acetyltransferase [Halobacillus kuroshimensis]
MIRTAERNDAGRYKRLMAELEGETDFLLYGRDERTWTLDRVEGMIQHCREQQGSLLLLSEDEWGLNGHVTVLGGSAPRNRHAAGIITGVKKRVQGTGVADELFDYVDSWARDHGILRLELTVMVRNTRAVRFYEKHGYIKEGRKQGTLMVDGQLVDEYMMAKIL